MSKSPRKTPRKAVAERVGADQPPQADFEEVVSLIESARTRALAAVNTVLIDLYWQIGEYISHKIAAEGWGKSTVGTLAEYIQRRQPGRTGFSASNLWRMRQFFETYRGAAKTRTTGARIVLDPQPAGPGRMQARGGTRILPPSGYSGTGRPVVSGNLNASLPGPCSIRSVLPRGLPPRGSLPEFRRYRADSENHSGQFADDNGLACNGPLYTFGGGSVLNPSPFGGSRTLVGPVAALPLRQIAHSGGGASMSGSWPKIVRDPVHDIIPFHETPCDKLLLSLIETAEFQRLRRIKQFGMSELVFPGANHNRFAHSLGVMNMARRFLHTLDRECGTLPEEQQTAVLTASLLHDVGHGPFSHTFEKVTGRKPRSTHRRDHTRSRDRDPQTPGVVRPEPSADTRRLLRRGP